MLKGLKLGPKLVGGFVLIGGFTLVLGLTGLYNLREMRSHFDEVGRDFLPSVQSLLIMSQTQTAIDGAERGLVSAASDATERTAAYQRIAEHAREFESAMRVYGPMPKSDDENKLFKEYTDAYATWWKNHEELLRLSHAWDADQQKTSFAALNTFAESQLHPAFTAVDARIDTLVVLNRVYADQALVAGEQQYANSRMLVAIAVTLCLICSVVIGLATSRSIVAPLTAVVDRAERLQTHCIASLERGLRAMSGGDLSVPVELTTPPLELQRTDEIGVLAKTVDGMIATSKEAVASYGQLQTIVRQLITETDQLAHAAQDGKLSTRGNAAQFNGAYRDLVQGFNTTLDLVLDPINDAAVVLERVAARDLTARVTADYKGDHAKIKTALNTAVENLQQALGDVSSAAEQVAAAADQIATGSQSLAQGASEQASTIEEVSSSLHEITSMAKMSAANAKEAETLAEAAKSGTDHGSEKMDELTTAMAKLKSSSDQTAKIVKTIDEIAFQTNLLALNAAVEAARAGDAGKGFAVVADEVRALSIRAADAAKQTAALIEESVGHTQQGVAMTKDVQETFVEIAKRASRVREVMAEMAAASEQQTLGIAQVNSAVEQMNAVTQQTAASAEESASAAEELTSQATQVKGLVEQFALHASSANGTKSVAPRGRRIPPSLHRSTKPRPALVAAGGFDDADEPSWLN